MKRDGAGPHDAPDPIDATDGTSLDDLRELMDAWREGGTAEPAEGAKTSTVAERPTVAEPLDTAAILRRVKRRSLGLRLVAAGEVAIVAIAIAALSVFAVRHPDPFDVVVMAGLALSAVASLAFSFWNRQGRWRPAAETTAAYLRLARSRALGRRTALRAGRWLLTVEIALFVPWIWHATGGAGDPLRTALAYAFLALVAGGMALAIAMLDRWTRRELAALREAEE